MAASLSYDTASRRLERGQLAPVYYLTGDEDILKDDLVAQILDRAVEAAGRDFNVDVRAAGDLDGEALHALMETPPMLAERRAVVVKNLEQWRKNAKVWSVLERYVANPNPTTVLVLVHGAGEKPNRKLVEQSSHVVASLSPDRVAGWVEARASRADLMLQPDAVRHLVEVTGGDLSLLHMEIEKLAAALAGRSPGAADIAPFVGVRRGETPQDWVATVLQRDVSRSVGMLETVLSAAGVSGVRLVGMLGTALVGVALARSLASEASPPRQVERKVIGHIARVRPAGLGDWKRAARDWIQAARLWSRRDIARALSACYAADRALKSTTFSDAKGTLTSMLLCMLVPRAT